MTSTVRPTEAVVAAASSASIITTTSASPSSPVVAVATVAASKAGTGEATKTTVTAAPISSKEAVAAQQKGKEPAKTQSNFDDAKEWAGNHKLMIAGAIILIACAVLLALAFTGTGPFSGDSMSALNNTGLMEMTMRQIYGTAFATGAAAGALMIGGGYYLSRKAEENEFQEIGLLTEAEGGGVVKEDTAIEKETVQGRRDANQGIAQPPQTVAEIQEEIRQAALATRVLGNATTITVGEMCDIPGTARQQDADAARAAQEEAERAAEKAARKAAALEKAVKDKAGPQVQLTPEQRAEAERRRAKVGATRTAAEKELLGIAPAFV